MNTEKHYITGLKQGKHRDFEALYRVYADKLYRYCYSFIKNREETEDLVQELFISLWNQRENIQLENSLSKLLFTMAKNRLINSYRATLNSPVFEDYVLFCNTLSGSSQTEAMIDFQDFCYHLNRAKRLLNETQREVFTLSKENGLSHKEIAQRMNLSEQTIKNQLSIAMKMMSEALKNFLPMMLFFRLI